MLRFVADENFNSQIVRGLLLQRGNMDIVRLQDVGLGGAGDRRFWPGPRAMDVSY